MVKESEYWLEENDNEQDNADDRMVTMEKVFFISDIDTKSKSSKIHGIGKDLERGVKPDDAREMAEPNANRASREEDDKRESGERAMRNEHFLLLCDL